MQKPIIQLANLTKDYHHHRGVFGLNLSIKSGEVFGIVGENGAGKTTTLRMLMGFIKPSAGKAIIQGKDAWHDAAEIKSLVGYVPGEIAFPDTKSGTTFIKTQLELLKASHDEFVNELIDRFKIDLTADLKRMSKGMKQKVALVCAFMTKAPILLLDEPTTGLDPVMRDAFIDLILQMKQSGTTIIMSSHMFNELEPTCDRIGFLRQGKMVEILDQNKMAILRDFQRVTVRVKTMLDYQKLINYGLPVAVENPQRGEAVLVIEKAQTSQLTRLLNKVELVDLRIEPQGLDHYFEEEMQMME